MRIWDVEPRELCRAHLLGEHRELHGLWNILTLGKTGYSRHPETLRWAGRLAALYARHEALVHEMQRREEARFGLATMCIGVGQGIAMVVEKAA